MRKYIIYGVTSKGLEDYLPGISELFLYFDMSHVYGYHIWFSFTPAGFTFIN